MKWLIHIEKDKIVRHIPLEKQQYSLGRGDENDIVFRAPKISRTHAFLVKDGEEYQCIDNDSTNHSFVNDRQIERTCLKSKDTIQLSNEVVLLYLDEHDFQDNVVDLLNQMWAAFNKEDFLRLQEVIGHIISLDNLDHILQTVLKEIVNLVSAERGFITLVDQHGDILKDTNIVHNIPVRQSGDWDSLFSQSTVQQAIHTKEPVFILRSDNDEPQDFSHSIIALNLQSVMCAPLLFNNVLVGVLYVDSGYQRSDFSERDRFFFTILAEQAAIAIENAKLYNRIQYSMRKLRLSEAKHRILLQAVPDPVAVYDLAGNISYVNPAFARVFGWTLEAIATQSFHFVPVEKLTEARLFIEKITQREPISGIETYRLSKEGERIEVSISGAGFFDTHDELRGYVLTFQNISARKKNEEEIKFLAYHDVLTQLPNRKAFYERLDDNLSHISYAPSEEDKPPGGQKTWALLFLDLDRFKYINETLGHDVGDELLKAVAERLRACLPETDHIFRLGGDEFTIIINDLQDDPMRVLSSVTAIGRRVSQPYEIHGQELYVTVSIGISFYPDNGETVEVLVKNADMAMYAAKENGGGYHFFTEELNEKAQERLLLESGLRQAIRENQFLVYYQPLVDNTSHIVGMEALIRWNHPERGLISPAQFIPLAEETSAIVQIGEWVLMTACQQLKQWHEMGYAHLYMSVNVATRQFKEPDFVGTIERVLESTGINPDKLKLEITESSIMDKPDEAIAKMKAIRDKGVHFSIDDFGTGYSSLSQMKYFPIDTLKIDRSFVTDAIENRDDQEIIKAILSMAHNLHIETVAEGVETLEQRDFLAREGCEMMQGYYFGRPMPEDEFEEILKTH